MAFWTSAALRGARAVSPERSGKLWLWSSPQCSEALFDQRLMYTDKRVRGAANRLQQFAAVCSASY
eukprot:4778297-Alexandrium_andersonii.AAC.1